MSTAVLDDKTSKIFEEIKTLTFLQTATLVKAFEEEFGITASAPVAAAAAPAGGGGAAWLTYSTVPMTRIALSANPHLPANRKASSASLAGVSTITEYSSAVRNEYSRVRH